MDSKVKQWLEDFAVALREQNKQQDARAVEEFCEKLDTVGAYIADHPVPGLGGLFEHIMFATALAGLLTVE